MATFGKYEVVTELHSGERGSVFSARVAGGGREIKHAVKAFNASTLDMDEQFWEGQSFTERAKVQQRAAEANGAHWAPVYDIGTSPAGTYYVTDFHPLSAASLVTGRVDVSPGVLYSIVRSVVAGLAELKTSAGRPHGNLKPTNVLINSRGDVTVAGAVLTDPASAADAAKAGESGDLYALGQLIHLLVMGKPFLGGADWPLAPAREWSRLGHRQGRMWRRLCEDLLSPDPSARPPGIDAVAKRVRRLVPRRARPSRRLSLAVAVAVVLVAAGAAALLGLRDAAARREVCAAKERWAGGLTAALARPQRRVLLESDPDLIRVVRELDRAGLGAFDCGRPGGRFAFNPDIRKFRQTQDTLDAVRRAERGLSPIQWRQLARAAELQGRFQARGWNRPAQHLAARIAGARPGAADLAGGIERFLVALAAVDRDLPDVEEKWLKLQTTTRGLDDTRDPLMKAFAAHLRTDAASSIELSDSGFGRLDRVNDASTRADRLLAVHKDIADGHYDEDRFKEQVVSAIHLDHVQAADIDRFLNGIAAYRVQEDKVRQAVAELKQQAAANEKLVRNSGLDEIQTKEFNEKLSRVDYHIKIFGDKKVIPSDIVDGQFDREMQERQADVASLMEFVRKEDVQQWLAKLAGDDLGVPSRELTAYWNWWTKSVAPQTAAKQAGQSKQIDELQNHTRRLKDVLMELDHEMPQVPRDLSDPVLVKAAEVKREEVLAGIIKNNPPIAWAREPESVPKMRGSEAVKAAGPAFLEWTRNLAELGKDFPLRRRILTPDVRPDERWQAQKPEFWNDRIVKQLVEQDVDRLQRLRALAKRSRGELLKVAQDEARTELALHAWRLLGGVRTQPAWPTQPGELAAEDGLRRRLRGLLAPLEPSDEATRAAREINEEGPRRWRRFAEGAGVDEPMLASAAELREAFGVGNDQFASLTPEARFNLSLLEIRRRLRDESEDRLAPLVADLSRPAREVKDPAVATELRGRLARIEEKEPFADAVHGEQFVLKPAGADVQITFRRVKPQGRRPFFLATTELSFAQFSAIVAANSAWDDLRPLVWSPQPGELGDPRRGPRVWEWVMRPAPQMYPTQLWLHPDEANDFPDALRDPRVGKFNTAVLSDAAGGMPRESHPVQYLPPVAAMYVAGLAGCRLPTSAEWRAAYDAYEKAVPTAEWNLRDQTWQVQQDHVAKSSDGGDGNADGTGSHGPHAADEGIYLPPTPKVATGAAARALDHRDGTLFFRVADGPGGTTFKQLVGNVAEFVCDASEPFERLPDRRPQRLRAFVADPGVALFVIGGSALSPPEMPVDVPQPVKPDGAYADVGFRLAFTAPSKNLAEKLEWVLAGQGFVRPGGDTKGDAKTASAEKPPQS